MALNDYLTIGNSGLRVSPFCLGIDDHNKRSGPKTRTILGVVQVRLMQPHTSPSNHSGCAPSLARRNHDLIEKRRLIGS